MTAFTVIASFEVAGRLKGAQGLFNWIGRLPWSRPGLLVGGAGDDRFMFGGFGGAINAAYAMNAMVHNTAWIMGHFHVTLGTTVALTFMGATYWLLPRLLGRDLRLHVASRAIQPYLWVLGMAIFSTSYHIAGLRGLPRRVYSARSREIRAAAWHGLTRSPPLGGVILFSSALAFVDGRRCDMAGGQANPGAGVRVRRRRWSGRRRSASGIASGCGRSSRSCSWRSRMRYPLMQLLAHPRFGSPAFKPF